MTSPNPAPTTIPCPAQYWPQQSPVDLADAVRTKFANNYIKFDYPSKLIGTLKKDPPPDDHGFNLVLKPNSAASIIVDGSKCSLKKIHFHARSEHRNAGRDYAMEIHLVHEIDEPKNGSTLVVLGVFIDEKKKHDSTPKSFRIINTLLATPEVKSRILSMLQNTNELLEDLEITFNPSHCLPDNRKKFFRYEGSLTTAPFTESVSWIVFRNPIRAVADDIEEIRALANHTARPIQPINRRFILRSF